MSDIPIVGDVLGGISGSTAADASREGAQMSAAGQREALDYLKLKEGLPMAIRDQALMGLAAEYGIDLSGGMGGGGQPFGALEKPTAPGDPFGAGGSFGDKFGQAFQGMMDRGNYNQDLAAYNEQQAGYEQYGTPTAPTTTLTDRAMSSPLYKAILGGQQAGEQSIARHASATGGLRSGNIQDAFYDYNTQLENKALLESYNQQRSGLEGLAGLQSYAPQIAQGMSNIGNTLGQGQIAGAQAEQQGMGNMINLGLGIAGLF